MRVWTSRRPTSRWSSPAAARCASTSSGSGASSGRRRTAAARSSTSSSRPTPSRRSRANGGGNTMLTADLVQATRRNGALELVRLEKKKKTRALAIAERFLAIAREHEGRTREELAEAYAAEEIAPADRRLADGLRKLIED